MCSAPARPTGPIRTSSPTSPGAWPLTRPRRGCRCAGPGPPSSAATWPRAPRSRCCSRSPGSPRPGRWPATPATSGHQLLQGRPAGPLARRDAAMSGAGLTLPPAGGGISDQTVAFAAELIDRSGKAPVIEAALAHHTGRPRPLPVRAVLTALLCLALDDRPLFLTDATRLLFQQLPETSRRLLGVPGTATTERAFKAAYRRVRYCFGAIRSVMDPSPLPKNRRLTEQDLKARTRPMTPAQAQAARGRLEAFINALIEASISALTDDELGAYDGSAGPGRHPGPAVLPRPVQAHRPVRQRPRRRLVRPRRRPPRARRRQRKAPAQDLLGAGSHHRHHGPPARRPARAPQPRRRPGPDPARRRPRRHRRPRAGLPSRPRPQDRLARLRPRLHPGPPRAVPPPRPRAGLLPGHGLPRRPARHPGKQPGSHCSSREPGTAPPCPSR